MSIKKYCSVLAILLLFIFPGSGFSKDKDALAVKYPDRYFRNAYYTGTEYFWLRGNGTYRRFNREHMGIFLADKGTWLFVNDEFVLKSEERVKHIVCYPKQIHLYHFKEKDKKLVDFIHSAKEAINFFLKKQKVSEFSSNQVEEIKLSKIKNSPDINVLSGVETVSRGELEGLLKVMDNFSASKEKNVFHVRPINYKAFTFLVWLDDLQAFGNNIDYVKNKIDKLPKNGELDMVLTETTQDIFDQESASTQPFIFYPEMNKCVPQPSQGK